MSQSGDSRGGSRAIDTAPVGSEGAAIEVLLAAELLGIGLGQAILVVDDDATNLTAYEAALAPLGRPVVLVQSGMQALAKLLDQDFALLLLDVSMPEMSGLETAQHIRQRARNKGLPIIFITGIGSSASTMLEAYDAGAFDFVVKPIPPDVLRAKARVYLQLQERTQAYVKRTMELREATRRLSEADDRLRERDHSAATALRLQKLQDATAALAQASTPAEVASVAVRLGAEAVNASAACMWIVRPDGALVVEASHGIPASYLDPWRILPADAELAMTRVQRDRRAIWVENAADYAREAPELFERARAANRPTAFAMLPLVAEDRAIGVVSFGFDRDRAFPDEERRFLAALVRTCEQALDRARLYVAEREARRVAEEASRRKDELIAMLSHELRNPLWAIVSALGVINLRDGAADRELAIIGRQVEHLTHIVGGLLDFSRSSLGRMPLRREAVQLASEVTNALDGARRLIDSRGHQISVDVAGDLVVDADRHRLGQVLENLLTNAVKYTGDHGRIAIAAVRDAPFIRISVRDNGRGIAPGLLAELFEPFVQGEQPLARSDGGLGIGLTLVRTLVELHGGTIDAHSDGPGTGATFTVRWPQGGVLRVSSGDDSPVARPAAVKPRRVLVVDDNADAAEMLATLLRTFGHEVVLALDGAAALDAARDFAPHVALLDIGLPVMDGYELARRLRELDTCKNTLLVAVTGYGAPGDQQRSKAAGFAHHFVKPVTPATFETLLASLPDDDTP